MFAASNYATTPFDFMSHETGNLFSGRLPARWSLYGKLHRNTIMQLAEAAQAGEFRVSRRKVRGATQVVLVSSLEASVLVIERGRHVSSSALLLDVATEHLKPTGYPFDKPTDARWLSPRTEKPQALSQDAREKRCQDVLESWVDAFAFREENVKAGTLGLREPQMGALHAILAHWSVRDDVATVVMPTGTGKTDTMLATYAHQRMSKLLVVVPTDPLRSQIA